MTAAELAERIGITSQRDEWYDARCPAHDDERPSFSFTGSPRGLVLYCRAGCAPQDIAAALQSQYPGINLGRIAALSRSRRPPIAVYQYKNDDGTLLYEVLRYEPKDFRARRPDGKGGWIYNLKDTRRVLYRLPELRGRTLAWVVEGEKDADRLWALRCCATTNPGGAGKWTDNYAEQLQGQGITSIIILPDNDEAGERHAQVVARSCKEAGLIVAIVRPPGLPEKGDISDWLDHGHSRADLIDLIGNAEVIKEAPPADEAPSDSEVASGDALPDRLVQLAEAEGIELFHSPLREPFVSIPIREHREVWRLDGEDTRMWLSALAWRRLGKALGPDKLGATLQVLKAKAVHEGPEIPVYVRTAWNEDALYIDLVDPEWRVVKVSASGYEVLASSPVRFRHYGGMATLPDPESGGNIDELWRYLNVPDPRDRRLLIAWLATALLPDIPRPILVLHGDQGAGKTTAARILASLVDPHHAPLVRARDEAEFVQALAHHHVAILDNLSSLPDWLSDLLSRAVTGEGFSKRQLYSDDQDVIYAFRRAIILTGINLVVTKPDLLDRSLLVGTERLGERARIEDRVLLQEFAAAQPQLFGALLTLLSRGMALYPETRLPRPPRMADFARWGAAVIRATGGSVATFEQDLQENTARQNEQALAESFTATLLLAFMEERGGWEGTAEGLLGYLRTLATEKGISKQDIARTPQVLGRSLREVRPNLNALGFDIRFRKSHNTRAITITRQDRARRERG